MVLQIEPAAVVFKFDRRFTVKVLDKIVIKIENYLCIATFIIMLLLTFANVVSRFVLHFSLSFTEEIVTGLFVIASLAGTSVAVRRDSHLGLDFFVGYMPKAVQKVLSFVALILAVIMCGIMFYYGILMVRQEMFLQQVSATMQWPEWIYGMTVPVGAGILLLRYILGLIRQFMK